MPSEKILVKKQETVKELVELLNGSVAGVLVDYKGISVAKDAELRRELRQAGVKYTVIKNGIIVRAIKEAGYEGLEEYLVGPSALATSAEDPVAAAKIIAKHAETIKDHFVVKAGFVDGKVIDATEVDKLAKLPSREGLIAQVLGGLNAPISGLVTVLNGNIRGLAIALNQIAEQKQNA